MIRPVRLCLVLTTFAAFGSAPALALEGLRPLDAPWAADAGLRIEWAESWQATYEANTTRWKKELESTTGDRRRREQLLVLRRIELLQALSDRHPGDSEKRIAACKEIAECFAQIGCLGRANYWLKKLADDFPGRPDVAGDALLAILQRTQQRPNETEEGEEWVSYAAAQLIAANQEGRVPDGHPGVELAWKARFEQCMRQHRFWEASQSLQRLSALRARDDWWRNAEAELYFHAGRGRDALKLFEDLVARNVPGPASSRVRQLSRQAAPWPGSSRMPLGLQARWDAIRAGRAEADASVLQSLYEESAKGNALTPAGSSRHTSVWTSVDQYLRARTQEAMSLLRVAQERVLGHPVRASRQAIDPQALFAAFRRYPWARPVHDTLIEFGEESLRQGHSGLALRAFQDVLSHAPAPAARSQAQVGLWLAILSESQDPKELGASLRGVAADAFVPWMGARKPVAFVRERLLAAARDAGRGSAPPLSKVARRTLREPPASAWPAATLPGVEEHLRGRFPSPLGRLQAAGQWVLLSGPNLLAAYGDDLSKPLWWRTAQRGRERIVAEGRAPGSVTVRGPFLPALAKGRVYSRWGLDQSHQRTTGLAAFDATSGEMLWATHGDPAWRELSPMSDPAVADGRLYVLATRGSPAPVQPVFLVCLDAEQGALLWQRLLASERLELLRADGAPRLPRNGLDLAHYGSAVTIHQGAVYCSTNAGFVARCDARDGLVEWVRTYPRVRLGSNIFDVLRRQGAAPVIAGSAAVFLPRDCEGVFALDRRNGKLLWDAPFVPSDEAIGLVGQSLLLTNADHLVGLDVSRGKVVWTRRFAGRIRGRPAVVGSSVYVGTRDKVHRVAAQTGRTVEESRWDSREPIRGFALRGDSLSVIVGGPSGTATARGPRNPGGASRPRRLPLRHAWRLPRANPTMWVPPAEAKVRDKVYLLSEGVLECLTGSAQDAIVWQRPVPRGFLVAPAWAEKTMVFVYPERVLAFDAATGERRWESGLPFAPREWRVCGPYLFVGNLREGRHTSVLRLSTGEMLWHRQFRDSLPRGYRGLFDAFAWDGEKLHFMVSELGSGERSPADLIVRPADGRIVGFRHFPGGDGKWPHKIAFGDGFAFGISREGFAYDYSLRDGAVALYQADLGEFDVRGVESLEVTGRWVQVQWNRGRRRQPHKSWILRRGDPDYVLCRKNWGRIVGDTFYEKDDATRTVTAVDLLTGNQVAYRVPTHPDRFKSILDFHGVGETMWVVSGEGHGRGPTEGQVRVDVFDRKSGRHLDAQVLRDILFSNSTVAWGKWAVLITDTHGLHALVSAPPGATSDPTSHVAYRIEQPIRIDGSLDDWEQAGVIELRAEQGPGGVLRVAHDTASLYLTVSYLDAWPVPRVGRNGCGGGDSLEVGLTTDAGSYRCSVGVDARGRIVWDALGPNGVPEATQASVRHELGTQQRVYEIAIPLEGILRLDDASSRQMELSIAVWDDGRGGTGPVRPSRRGGARVGPQLLVSAHETVYLHPRTRQQHEAASAIVRELPDLPASFSFFEQGCRIRDPSTDALVGYCWDLVRRHPRSASAEAALLRIDRRLREESDVAPSGGILRRAAKAGVPEAALRRFKRQTEARLSQWVHVARGSRPRSLIVELSDGMDATDEWGHRAYWGERARNWPTRPTCMGRADRVPQDEWHELRFPLHFLGMHDKPICGIGFSQLDGRQIVWDRSALVTGGKQRVFLDDELPKGTTSGSWEWVGEPVHSGAAAHTAPPPKEWYHLSSHALELDRPIIDHLTPPLDRPYLSQWVFLDPTSRPTMISIDLHDGTRWRSCALWGARNRRGRYMGPLPKPGEWHELRLPLAWTPFAARPIAGIAFGHYGGRAIWDRTAVIASGKEHLLIDDKAPAVRRGGQRRRWLSWLRTRTHRYVGQTTAVPGKLGVGLWCDGSSGYVDVPDSPELEPDHLTIEAWIYVEAYPPFGDTRRWIVNKNRDECGDGHYALMVNRDQAGAYLNIGGGEENRRGAWSRPGTITLKRWHHLAMTYDGAMLRLYVDGNEKAATPINKQRVPGTTTLQIGRRQDGYVYFGGIIDEVRLYDQALSADAVKARFASGGAPPTKEAADAVVGHWGFDADAAPVVHAAEWQWVDRPVKSGKKAHTQPPARGFAAHCLSRLEEPITEHLPFDLSRATTVLRTNIPRLGPTDDAWTFFRGLLQLHPDPRQRVELCRWFLRSIPDHPRQADALSALLQSYKEAGGRDPVGSVEALILKSSFSVAALYHYRRRHLSPARSYVRAWQILGPFPNPGGPPFGPRLPPDSRGVQLDRTYQGAAGDIRWTRHESLWDCVDLDRLFEPNEYVAAYAACWIHSDRKRKAVLAVGSDDDCTVWINRRVVMRGDNVSYATPGEFVARVELQPGWNEVLVKVSEGYGDWKLYFELLDPLARGPLKGVRSSGTPPRRTKGRGTR